MGMFPDYHLTASTYPSWFVLLGDAKMWQIFITEINILRVSYYPRDLDITNSGIPLEFFFRRYAGLLLKYGQVTFTDFVSKGISHPPFYGDLIYKLRRIKNNTNYLASSKRIIGRILKRKYDPIVVRRTVCMVLGPSTVSNLHTLFHCTLTNQAGGTR